MNPKYLWLDIETTGLDHENDVILEVAMLVTDSMLHQIGDSVQRTLYISPNEAERLDSYVRQMHTSSGLLDDCRSSTLRREELDEILCNYIESFDSSTKLNLAGFSVHFDRNFMIKCCPRFMKKLCHRHLDISSLKMALSDTTGEPDTKLGIHRAMPDILEALAQARSIYSRMKVNMLGYRRHMTK